jgi:hypothetical protein
VAADPSRRVRTGFSCAGGAATRGRRVASIYPGYQSGRSLWKRMRMGRGTSAVHPCWGHSRRRGNCFAPGTGRSTKGAPHLGQFIPSESSVS